MNFEDYKPFLEKLAKGIAVQFGNDCEVAIHKLSDDCESTISIIENGHVSNRKVGDGASEIVLASLKARGSMKDRLGYLTRTKDGRLLKSSSICIRDENSDVIGVVSINYDITNFSMAANSIGEFIKIGEEKIEPETIPENVNDLLDILIEDSCHFIGKPVALMSKEDKIKAIHYLEKKGAFLVKKSGDKVSKYYDISKYTLYNYLGYNSIKEDKKY